MNSRYVTVDNLLRVFPEVLSRSAKIQALGEVVAKYLAQVVADTENCSIYANVDTLPEAVLDILAYDFKVDWYYSTYDLAVKREIIKNCIAVHKTQGTKSGCLTALQAIFGSSTLEEWIDVGGRPYHYTVGIPVTTGATFDHSMLLATLRTFVPCRCILEDGGAAYFGRVTFKVCMVAGCIIYTPPFCGTKPHRSTYGRHEAEAVTIAAGGSAVAYRPPMTGQAITGTHPIVNTLGEITDDGLAVTTSTRAVAYSPKMCGSNKVL